MKRNVHQKLTFVGIRALAIRYSEAKPWHNALLRQSGNFNNDKSITTEPENKRTRCMVSDDVMNSLKIVAYCETYFFNMELPLYRKHVFNVMLNQRLPSTRRLKER